MRHELLGDDDPRVELLTDLDDFRVAQVPLLFGDRDHHRSQLFNFVFQRFQAYDSLPIFFDGTEQT